MNVKGRFVGCEEREIHMYGEVPWGRSVGQIEDVKEGWRGGLELAALSMHNIGCWLCASLTANNTVCCMGRESRSSLLIHFLTSPADHNIEETLSSEFKKFGSPVVWVHWDKNDRYATLKFRR